MGASTGDLPDDAIQLVAGACCYLEASRALRFSRRWERRGGVLLRPTLHLLAHGIELLLKFPLAAAGKSQKQIRDTFGHDLTALWHADANMLLRLSALTSAGRRWKAAERSGKYPEDDFTIPADDALTSALQRLSWLHTKKSGYALRYVVPPDTLSPRPAFLAETFHEVAQDALRRPRDFLPSV